MNIVKTPRVVFDEKEIEALQTIARINCNGIDCHEDGCPFVWVNEQSYGCIKGMIRDMMIKRGISY